MGAQIPGDHHVLAPPLAGGDPVLRLPPRRPPDHLHHERDRGPERQAAPSGPHPRPLPVSDDAALKLLYLVLNLAEREWRMPHQEWGMAKAQFAILFDDRFQLA